MKRRTFFKTNTAAAAGAVLTGDTVIEAAGSDTVKESSRQLDVADGADIIVLGGGPSGCAAAIAAGRLGLDVLLVEALGLLSAEVGQVRATHILVLDVQDGVLLTDLVERPIKRFKGIQLSVVEFLEQVFARQLCVAASEAALRPRNPESKQTQECDSRPPDIRSFGPDAMLNHVFHPFSRIVPVKYALRKSFLAPSFVDGTAAGVSGVEFVPEPDAVPIAQFVAQHDLARIFHSGEIDQAAPDVLDYNTLVQDALDQPLDQDFSLRFG